MSLICAGVFSTVLYLVLAIVVLLLMVLIHEFGHYVIGRMLGFKINEFSIGFGKAIFQKKNKRGELISLRIFPLGGYCAFAGEDDGDDSVDKKDEKPDSDKASEIIEDIKQISQDNEPKEEKQHSRDYLLFNEQKPWKRLLVYGAGVTFNFISAIIFSFILLISFGYDIPKVASLDTNYSYLYGELQEGDVIWGVDGKNISFAFNGTFASLLKEAGADTDITLNIKRDNQKLDVVIRLKEEVSIDDDGNEVKKLVAGFSTEAYAHSFLEALGR